MSRPEPVDRAIAAGLAVVPADMNKRPKVKWKQWQTEPQTPEEVEALGHGSIWGVVTGARYGFTVLDFDEAHGGMETMAALGLEPHVLTPGGAHVYVIHPGHPVKNSARKFEQYPGMDVRGDGGLAWFAGRGKKGVYTPVIWPPFPEDLDPALAEELFPHPQSEADRAPRSVFAGTGNGVPEALRYLDRLAEDIITAEPGTSNAVLNKAAFSVGGLVAAGQLDEQYAYDVLFSAAEDRGAGEPAAVIDAGLASGADKPWKFDPDDSDWIPVAALKVFRQGGVPDPEPFPVDALPSPLDEFVEQVAKAVSCPPDYVGAALLPVLGTALGGYVDLRITDSWRESPLLYVALVGPPSARKTPPMKLVLAPVRAAEQAMFDAARDEADWNEVDPPQLVADDSTIEAFFGVLEKNPRGVILRADELVGWVNGMNQYKGGAGRDRQHWLSIWSREPIRVNRKTTKSHYIPKPFACVLGGIQPDPLEALMYEKNDGLLPRLLMARGEVTVPYLDRTVPTIEAAEKYAEVWNRLRDEGMHERTVEFTDDGYETYRTWANEHYKATVKMPGELQAAWGKMDAQAARIALILSQVVGEKRVSAETVDRATSLVRYFQGQAGGLLQGSGTANRFEKQNAARQKALARYIRENPGADRAELMTHGPEWARDGRLLDRLLEDLERMGVWRG